MRKHNVNVQKRKKHYTVGAILWLIVEYVSLIFFGLCGVGKEDFEPYEG